MPLTPDELKALAATTIPVVVVGAGPAGITLAREFERLGVETLLVEAGGWRFPEPEALEAYDGSSSGRPYPLPVSRLRFFGGTSGHWGGWCRPYDEEDLRPVRGQSLTGWPLAWDEVYRHLDEAHDVLEIPRAASLAQGEHPFTPGLEPERFGYRAKRMYFSPPTRFGQKYRGEIEYARHVRLSLETSLLSFDQRDDGLVESQLLTAGGERVSVRSARLVLAMGGIENARAILWSNRATGRGFGGSGDWVGRTFMEHFGLDAGHVIAPAGLDIEQRERDGFLSSPRLCPGRDLLRSGRVPNHMIQLTPASLTPGAALAPGYLASVPGSPEGQGASYRVTLTLGTPPSRDSRVTLGEALDARGVPKIDLDWRIPDAWIQAAIDSALQLFRGASGVGWGRFRPAPLVVPAQDAILTTGMHHMGTTRMARRERDGVVDTDGRVFGTRGVYVAGSSVFPTCGYANPTLTIVALAIRQAAHLAEGVSA